MDNRSYIPEHLLFDILLWLPVTSLLRFKSVCKSWFTLIDSPMFIFQHFGHNSHNDNLLGICRDTTSVGCSKFCLLSDNKYEVFNNFDCELPWNVLNYTNLAFSSNGIVCLVHCDRNISLWNPAMKQWRSIQARCVDFVFPLFGFGFNVNNNDYNIVRTTFHSTKTFNILVEVYSLRADSWRTMLKNFALPPRFWKSCTYHITKDGTCFWIAYSSGDDDIEGNVILSFDLNEETYETMPLPVGNVPSSAVIDFLGDKLAYIHGVDHLSYMDGHSYYEIWVLHEYGVKESWNKAWKIGPAVIPGTDNVLFPSRFILNGESLLFTNKDSRSNTGIFHVYNLGTKENEYLELQRPNLRFWWSVSYTESLFPVKRVNKAH